MSISRNIVLLVAIILAVGFVFGCLSQNQDQNQTKNTTGTTLNGAVGNASAETKTGYDKTQAAIAAVVLDGTYSDDIAYQYHSGTEVVNITVTVKDDTVTNASVVGINPNMMSAKYINGVNAALPNLVVGKKITELNIPKQVAGSSLTTAAFKSYIDRIIQDHSVAK